MDLSPIQPELYGFASVSQPWSVFLSLLTKTLSVPPNCSFEVDDIEKEWTWSKSFDFIWWRGLLGCFNDCQAMIQKCYECVTCFPVLSWGLHIAR